MCFYFLLVGLLYVGVNRVVINVLDIYGDGGLVGFVDVYVVYLDDGMCIVLDVFW